MYTCFVCVRGGLSVCLPSFLSPPPSLYIGRYMTCGGQSALRDHLNYCFLGVFYIDFLLSLRQSLSLARNSPIIFGWPVSELQRFTCPYHPRVEMKSSLPRHPVSHVSAKLRHTCSPRWTVSSDTSSQVYRGKSGTYLLLVHNRPYAFLHFTLEW